MKKYWKFIKKQAMPQLQLEDKKMPMTQINKHTNSLRFIHPGQGNEVSAARTIEPLPSSAAVVYFEAYVWNLNSRYECGVGIIQKDCALKKHPGQSNMSIGYLSSGQIYINRKKVKKLTPYKSKSTVGIGVIYSKQQVFFTLDGNLLQIINFEYNPAAWAKFYPCISLKNQNDHIQLKFKNFLYNYQELRNKIQNQCIQQIQKVELQNINAYQLVGDYLKFHGYKNTYNKLKSSHTFKEMNSFVEHPYWQSKLNFTANQQREQQSIMNQERKVDDKKNKDDDLQQDLIMNRKCSTRQRIMSDYWGDILPNQLPRKRIYEQQRLLLQSRRKSSVISNLSNDEGDNRMKRDSLEVEQNQLKKQQTQREKFLTQTRILILKLIRQQKIQQAQGLLFQQLPQIFEVLGYLNAYFYMHIYIRTIKNDGASKAMLYMRTQAEKFKKFKQQLYPVYTKQGNKLKFITFTQMMGLVSLKPGAQNDVLTSQQFYAFSNYVNELILKNMGLYPQSRLDNLVNHLKCMSSKSQQYQINGLSFVCDI